LRARGAFARRARVRVTFARWARAATARRPLPRGANPAAQDHAHTD
jgi:hypothetical protein